MSSTEAQNAFGHYLEHAARGGVVRVAKRNEPQVVIISSEEYDALTGAAEPQIDSLTAEFDAMLERMQTTQAKRSLRKAFAATPAALGRAAVEAVRPKAR